jgi:hypothetical protein
MSPPRLSLPGWYAAWFPRPGRSRDACVVFGFRDQDDRFVVEVGCRYLGLTDPVISGARFVGPFHSPEAAQAVLGALETPSRVARGA